MEKNEPFITDDVIPFFSLTRLGVNKPIKAMMRDDYKEPLERVDLREIAKTKRFGKSFVECLAEIDLEEGYADGFAYNSNLRMTRQRKKGVLKVVGPKDMFRYAGVRSMDVGWWNEDPNLDPSWQEIKRFPKPTSERTKYFDNMRKVYKFFNM